MVCVAFLLEMTLTTSHLNLSEKQLDKRWSFRCQIRKGEERKFLKIISFQGT